MHAISVVPPPMSMTMCPSGASTLRPAPSAAAIGSYIMYTSRPPACSADSRTVRISTLVEPDGIQITIRSDGLKRWPLILTFFIMPRSISSAALKSAITPSLSGRIVRMFWCVLPCICWACSPMATTLPVCMSMAMMEGSSTTTLPLYRIRVLAVPRSIANSCVNENSPICPVFVLYSLPDFTDWHLIPQSIYKYTNLFLSPGREMP